MGLISELTYANYVANRIDYGMSRKAAATIYPNADAMEARLIADFGTCDACNEPGQLEHREATAATDEGDFCQRCRQDATEREIESAEHVLGGER